jgi:hypothetical protein
VRSGDAVSWSSLVPGERNPLGSRLSISSPLSEPGALIDTEIESNTLRGDAFAFAPKRASIFPNQGHIASSFCGIVCKSLASMRGIVVVALTFEETVVRFYRWLRRYPV